MEIILNGASGGVIVMWDRKVVELLDHFVGEFLVACHSRVWMVVLNGPS